ncbi:MAG: redoxin domain-containing protein [Verrucomicrobiae bacterium]|nr:redoxin domain-containing protein [Verrucomicrobiae bacterium]
MKRILALLLAFAALLPAHADDDVKTITVGSKAPDFQLKNVDGSMVSLGDFADKEVVVLIFTCNHCPDARAARGRIKQLYSDYKDRNVAVITISGNDAEAVRLDELGWSVYGDSFAEGVIVAKEEGYEFPYLYDGDTQEATTAYGAQATPHSFVLDKDRIVRYTGRLDDMKRKPGKPEHSYIHAAVDSVLAGELPDPAVTRAVGCSTKWRSKRKMVDKVNADWKAQPVTLEELDEEGAKKLRANAAGNLRLINFWSTSCVPCLAEFPALVETYRRYQTRAFDFVTISLDPPGETEPVQKFLTKQQASLSSHTQQILEKEGRSTNNYIFKDKNPDPLAEAIDAEWSGALPYTVLLDGSGNIVYRHEGEVEPVALRKAIIKEFDKQL